MTTLHLTDDQRSMLEGQQGTAKQMGMRLLVDMAATTGAAELIPVQSAHLSGVSPLTGGLGLRQFLARLASDTQAKVAIPTSLNSAGCDEAQFEAMRISVPDFLAHSQEIIRYYTQLGVTPTQSCVPYEWEEVVKEGVSAWAESNAICFGNSYCDLLTNRESGLSALASALTGYTPKYGLLLEEARKPNIAVIVTVPLNDPTDFSILGDWIGKQRQASWRMPYGPIPAIKGLPADLTHEQKKALTAAAANYGCPLLYIDGQGPRPTADFQARLLFGEAELAARYEALSPKTAVSLVAIGCPQASMGEVKAVAEHLKGKKLPAGAPPLWVFTSATTKAIAEKTGLAEAIRQSGALLLENTCPEVVPYDQSWVHHILTNSMKAEHYLQSGLNNLPASVMKLADCVAVALGELVIEGKNKAVEDVTAVPLADKIVNPSDNNRLHSAHFHASGQGLPSQQEYTVRATAFVTDAPITFLGFVNRETGVIEEPGHPAHGESMAGKIAIFPKGIGSTVAPYVLLELFYRGAAPVAIINTNIDQQTTPACSLEGIPYAYNFDSNPVQYVNHGDLVELKKQGTRVTLQVIERKK